MAARSPRSRKYDSARMDMADTALHYTGSRHNVTRTNSNPERLCGRCPVVKLTSKAFMHSE